MKITKMRLRELTGTIEHPEGPFWEERLIRPVDVYPEFQKQTGAETNWQPIKSGETTSTIVLIFIEIETDAGITGLGGPVDRGTAAHRWAAPPASRPKPRRGGTPRSPRPAGCPARR